MLFGIAGCNMLVLIANIIFMRFNTVSHYIEKSPRMLIFLHFINHGRLCWHVQVHYFSTTVHTEDVYTSSVDNEHELLTKVSRVGTLSKGLHHQVSRRICQVCVRRKQAHY